MGRNYEKPTLDIILFYGQNVLTASTVSENSENSDNEIDVNNDGQG